MRNTLGEARKDKDGTGSLDSDTPCSPHEPQVVVEFCDTVGAWRDGELLVIERGAALLRRCIITNEPIAGFLTTRLYWHKPARYLALILAPGVYPAGRVDRVRRAGARRRRV
jgi:hypothetical protein